MVKQVLAQGFEDCLKRIDELKSLNPLIIFFTGSEDPKTGESWCPDCVKGLVLYAPTKNYL